MVSGSPKRLAGRPETPSIFQIGEATGEWLDRWGWFGPGGVALPSRAHSATKPQKSLVLLGPFKGKVTGEHQRGVAAGIGGAQTVAQPAALEQPPLGRVGPLLVERHSTSRSRGGHGCAATFHRRGERAPGQRGSPGCASQA